MPQNRTIQTERGTVEYAEAGGGPAILYFHGTGAGYEVVFPIEQTLLDAGFRMIVPNRPGYYGTSLAGRTTAAACAQLAVAVIDDIGISKVAVMGTSGGGPAALSFAALYPDRTTALVLQCAQTHRWIDRSWWPNQNRWIYPVSRSSFARSLLYPGYVWQCRLVYRMPNFWIKGMAGSRFDEIRHHPGTWNLYRLLRGSCLKCLSQPAGMKNDWDNLVAGPFPDAREIKCPTLVIYDPADPLVPIGHPKWALSTISAAKPCEIHAGGHLIWLGKEANRMLHERAEFLRAHAGDSN